MNCCKLRYMNDLGGLKAVPGKPNLTIIRVHDSKSPSEKALDLSS